jgi:hypothetical protein
LFSEQFPEYAKLLKPDWDADKTFYREISAKHDPSAAAQGSDAPA